MSSLPDPDRYLEILQPDRCPVCFLVHDYAQGHLISFLNESITDPGARGALLASNGFCRRHAWQAVRLRQSLGMSILYKDLLEKGLESLGRRPGFWSRRKKGACPVCSSEGTRESSLLEDFTRCWDLSPGLRSAFDDHGVLCFPHLEKAVSKKMSRRGRGSLVESGRKGLGRLIKDLGEFLEKQDYHRSNEAPGSEWDAWIRAVRLVSGEHLE